MDIKIKTVLDCPLRSDINGCEILTDEKYKINFCPVLQDSEDFEKCGYVYPKDCPLRKEKIVIEIEDPNFIDNLWG